MRRRNKLEKKLKRKCFVAGVLIIIGIIIVIISIYSKNLTELQQSYMNGFGIGLTLASLALLIKNGMALRNPKAIRKREIELTDERQRKINCKSMAITFRISVLVEAFVSAILAFTNNQLGIYMGFMVGIQLIIFCIMNVIISRKI